MTVGRIARVVVLFSALALAACGDDDRNDTSGSADAGVSDAGASDAGSSDAGNGGCTSDSDCLSSETCDVSTGVCKTSSNGPSCQQCACVDLLAAGGCANVCTMALNGTSTPNFYDGVSALSQCSKCLQDNCGGIENPPDPSDPSTCTD